MVLDLEHLTYLDTRPVNDRDRLCAAAWRQGGPEAEKALRAKWDQEKLDETRESVKHLLRSIQCVLNDDFYKIEAL